MGLGGPAKADDIAEDEDDKLEDGAAAFGIVDEDEDEVPSLPPVSAPAFQCNAVSEAEGGMSGADLEALSGVARKAESTTDLIAGVVAVVVSRRASPVEATRVTDGLLPRLFGRFRDLLAPWTKTKKPVSVSDQRRFSATPSQASRGQRSIGTYLVRTVRRRKRPRFL